MAKAESVYNLVPMVSERRRAANLEAAWVPLIFSG